MTTRDPPPPTAADTDSGPSRRRASVDRALDDVRRSRSTLYLIAALYVIVGFFIAVPAALSGDRISTFLGVLIIGGTLGVAAAVNILLRAIDRIAGIDRRLQNVHVLLQAMRSADTARDGHDQHQPQPSCTSIDLTTLGPGDPSAIVAASLDRDRFPRLVTTMDQQPPARSDPVRPASTHLANDETFADHTSNNEVLVDGTRHEHELTIKNLLREWRIGLRNKELAACRTIYSALVDTVDAEALGALTTQLKELADHTECKLRETFAACARARDIRGMLRTGEQMVALLPDRAIAHDFKRLEPRLRSRVLDDSATTTPTLRVVP